MVSKALPCINVGEVHLDDRWSDDFYGIPQRYGGVPVSTRIEHDRIYTGAMGRMESIHKRPLRIALEKLKVYVPKRLDKLRRDLRKRILPIDRGVSLRQHVQVWAIQHQYPHHRSHTSKARPSYPSMTPWGNRASSSACLTLCVMWIK